MAAGQVLLCIAILVTSLWSVRTVLPFAGSLIPTSSSGIGTVPLFNAWTIMWNADRLRGGLAGYWDAPIFHPAPGAFAFSEPQPATMLVAPIVWQTNSPAMAYNTYLLMSLFLNGWFAARLLRRLRVSWSASAVGGIAIVWHPLVHAQIDVAQLVPLWPVIWAISCAIQLRSFACMPLVSQSSLKRKIILKGIEAGAAVFCIFAVSIHHGLFIALLSPLTLWVFVPWRRLWQWLPGALAGMMVAAVLLAPLVLPMYRILNQNKFERSEALVNKLSARWGDLITVSPASLVQWTHQSVRRPWQLSPGWARLAFALIAVWQLRSIRRLRIRPAVRFLIMLGVVSALFSLGTNLQIAGWKPWLVLSQWYPGVSQIRSAFRFGYFMQLSLVLLAAIGFDQVLRCVMNRVRGSLLKKLTFQGILTGIGCLLALEIPPAPVQAVGVPDLTIVSGWQTFVRMHLEPGQCCIMLPYAPGNQVRDFDQTTRWMLRTTQQHIPTLNGYSGFFPKSHFDNQKVFCESPFSHDSLSRMSDNAVQFIVVQQQPDLRPAENSPAESAFVAQLVFDDQAGTKVFEILDSEAKLVNP